MFLILTLIAIWLIYGVIKSYFKVRALKRAHIQRTRFDQDGVEYYRD